MEFMRRIQIRFLYFLFLLITYNGFITITLILSRFPSVVLINLLVELFIMLQVLQAMIQMGVLVPTGDMTAVRRTAQFFLRRCFQLRIY